MTVRNKFLWGAATSAYQVEGNNIHSDWYHWEKKQVNQARSGKAAGHYERFRDDFVLARQLGHNAHRFSLEWARLEPAEGEWNEEAVQHYREVLLALRQNGLEPLVTLYHFTLPQWVAERGGWQNPQTIHWFARYVERIVEALKDQADFWITINEPTVYTDQAYFKGNWPPARRSWYRTWKVINNLIRAHQVTYKIIHRQQPQARVGIAKHFICFSPEQNRWADKLLAVIQRKVFNRYFLEQTRGTHDFIGVNYYFSATRHWDWKSWRVVTTPTVEAVSDMGWALNPEGLTAVLMEAKRYKRPIYITENGIADAKDNRRGEFLRSHLRAVEAAQARGADVRGYFYWSLLDNFEWRYGFKPRFGLIEIDYDTMQRRIRPSAYVYRAIIEQGK